VQLEWLYGYEAQSMRNSLKYTADGKIVYTAAAVGVVYDAAEHTQKYFLGHAKDDITALAITRDRKFVAVGEQGKRPGIYVWNASTQQVRVLRFGLVQFALSRRGCCRTAVDRNLPVCRH
jgi:microtubule-associated protein-like 6